MNEQTVKDLGPVEEVGGDASGKGASGQRDQLLDHNYDGIQEYDNPLPGWWTAIFWLCILFALPYVLYYHLGQGELVKDEYKSESAALAKVQAQEALKNPATNENLAVLLKDPSAMAAAKSLFQAKCTPCHGPQAQGGIGPNLTDDYWLHGNQLIQIYNTINNGVPAKGMVAWGKQLQPMQIRQLAAYVSTLHGTNPPNPKAPQGEKVQY